MKLIKKAGYDNNEIAKNIGVHPSTIGRELKRNSSPVRQSYGARSAHGMATLRKSVNSSVPIKIKSKIIILIYCIRCSSGLKNRVSISQRPEIVDLKERVGDFEMDTIIGQGKKGAITTIVDRASAFVKISIPTSKRAEDIEKESLRLLSPFKEDTHTITSDNGLEFANHQNIAKALECDYYFCHPYSSWERGLNEYTNGLMRKYIPKGSSFANLTHEKNQEIEDKLNHRLRKKLGWKTPY